MNKSYKTLDIYAAWLLEIGVGGIKNIIGVKVSHNGENLFYSILDDCFFRILPPNDPTKDRDKELHGRLFVEIYEYIPYYDVKTFGMHLYDYLKKDYITKEELIEIVRSGKWSDGYQSDFIYDGLNPINRVDFENSQIIEENIIDTVQEYEEKEERPISYEDDCIYGPEHYQGRKL